MAPQIHIKGLAFRSFLTTLERLHGKHVVERTIGRLPDETREALAYGTIVPSGWYPLGWQKALHVAAQAETGRDHQLARLIGQEGTRADFRGVYKFVAAVLAPETMVRHAGRAFSAYYDGGTLEVTLATRGGAKVQCRGCHGFDRNLWENVVGGIESALEVAGAKEVAVVFERGGRDGDSFVDLLARWR